MGHNIAVHREFYRLPSALLEIEKISQILMASESGTVHKLAGMTINQGVAGGATGGSNSDSVASQQAGESGPWFSNSTSATHEDGLSNQTNATLTTILSSPSIQTVSGTDTTERDDRQFPSFSWDPEVKRNILHHFDRNIRNKKPPQKIECESYAKEHDLGIPWRKIKDLVYNTYRVNK